MRKHILAVTMLGLLGLSSVAQAAEPLELQKVMRELGRNMQVLVEGISREDWALVAKTAPLIAEHPQPPLSEKLRIFSFMGAEMPKFKAFDGDTHAAAHELELAARDKNGLKVIAAFQQLQTGCLNCHQTFRAKFVEHFYGTTKQ